MAKKEKRRKKRRKSLCIYWFLAFFLRKKAKNSRRNAFSFHFFEEKRRNFLLFYGREAGLFLLGRKRPGCRAAKRRKILNFFFLERAFCARKIQFHFYFLFIFFLLIGSQNATYQLILRLCPLLFKFFREAS